MTPTTHALSDLEARAAAGEPLSRADAERVAACPDLIAIGMLAEGARRAKHGAQVTFCRVLEVPGQVPVDLGDAGEVRLTGALASAADALARVTAASATAPGRILTGFSLADLAALVGGDHLALADLARRLRRAGLESVAEVPLDRCGSLENASELVRAVVHGGLAASRATVEEAAGLGARMPLIEFAADLQRETGALHSFAPLPRVDPRATPSTGYDDVKTVAMARLMCAGIASIQVDWLRYGPKLAQVAIAYGADDLDAVPAVDTLALGHRRSPREDVMRQIRSAFAEPAERDARWHPVV